MNFTCDKCQRRYSIADDKVRGRTVKIRCKNCQNVVTVQGPAEERAGMMSIADVERMRVQTAPPSAAKNPWENESTRATPALDMSIDWFAMIKGKQSGPLNVGGLTEKVGSGEVSLRTYLWRKGMADWKRAHEIPELSILFAGGNVAAAPAPAPRKTGSVPVVAPAAALAPAPIRTNGKGSDSLAQLFADEDAPASTERHEAINAAVAGLTVEAEGAEVVQPSTTGKRKRVEEEEDPFKALEGIIDPAKLPPPGESTRFFIAQAGVNRRNPPWKIALFVAAAIGLPVAALYALSTLKVVPLEVTRVDESGHEVKQSVFSSEGVSGIKELLMGRNKRPPPEKPAPVAVRTPSTHAAGGTPAVGTAAKVDLPRGLSGEDLKQFYADQAKQDVGPKVRAGAAVQAKDTSGGLSQEQISKVVGQSASAFQACIEQELKRNPNFKGGKVFLNATIASSGVVKHVELDREDLNRADIGSCIKDRAKRMVFPASSGDEVEAQIPLFLGVTL